MADFITSKSKPPTYYELRGLVASAIDDFIDGSQRWERLFAFSSELLHLIIDENYRVSIGKPDSAKGARISLPLASLKLDPWAVGVGGSARGATVDIAAALVMRTFDPTRR